MYAACQSLGNALTSASFRQVSLLFLRPLEADIYPGITPTRNFCELCSTFVLVPELSIGVLSVGLTQNHTRGIYPGNYPGVER